MRSLWLKLCLKSLTVLFVLCIVFEVQAQYRNKCPKYMWEIAYIPVSYFGFEEAPAETSWVGYGSSEIRGHYKVEIGLQNQSDKTIKSVTFQWYLFNINTWKTSKAENREALLKEVVLMQDEISTNDTNEFKPKERFEFDLKLPCEKISNELNYTGNGKDLIMEFVVNEILFSDNSIWKRQ